MHSRAFEAIDDPHDPAWAGHAVDPRPGYRRPAFVAAVVVVLVGAVVLVAGGSGERAAPDRAVAASAAGFDPAPAATPAPTAPLTVTAPTAAPAATGSPDPAAATAPADPAPARGSGWAPAQVTRAAYSPRWLAGDTSGISPLVTARLDALARQLGRRIEVISGWRTTHEQGALYQRYLAGTGNLAAPPGTSLHEAGRAADAYVDGTALASVPGAETAALALGLHFPVAGEPWHVELVGDPDGSGR